ncbi:GOLPH3/VPS74 family protein [Microbacterium sp. KNMS]
MLIVEELHLLLTNAAGTQERPGTMRAYGEAAALITDLVLAGRVSLTDGKKPRIRVLSDAPTGHPVLDEAMIRLRAKDGARLESVITWSKLDPEREVVASLVQAGVLEVGERTFWGLGKPRTPERDSAPEASLRARLAAVLDGAADPGVADTTILAILQGLDVARHVLADEAGGRRPRALKARIAEIVESSPAGTAVERAVQAMNAAIMTAAIMPAMIAGASAAS